MNHVIQQFSYVFWLPPLLWRWEEDVRPSDWLWRVLLLKWRRWDIDGPDGLQPLQHLLTIPRTLAKHRYFWHIQLMMIKLVYYCYCFVGDNNNITQLLEWKMIRRKRNSRDRTFQWERIHHSGNLSVKKLRQCTAGWSHVCSFKVFILYATCTF